MKYARADRALVERIKALRASLHLSNDRDKRNKLLEELDVATRELIELIVQKEERLKSPMEDAQR